MLDIVLAWMDGYSPNPKQPQFKTTMLLAQTGWAEERTVEGLKKPTLSVGPSTNHYLGSRGSTNNEAVKSHQAFTDKFSS